MERILICSDIHRCKDNFLMALKEAAPVDRILIAGDLEAEAGEYERLTGLTPLVMVQGNCDAYLGSGLPLTADFTTEGKHFFMTHGHHYGVGYGRPSFLLADAKAYKADIVVFGHTHQALDETWDGIRFLNPGALRGDPKSGRCSYLILELDGASGTMNVQFRRLGVPPVSSGKTDDKTDGKTDGMMTGKTDGETTGEIGYVDAEQVAAAMREIKKGRTVSQIAAKLSIPFETAEKICRMVMTHPGVTADAVMTKLGY